VAGDEAHHQTRRRAAVAHVEHLIGFHEAADSAHPPDAVATLDDVGAKGAHGGCGVKHVLAGQQTVDGGFTDRDGAEHQRAMGNRLVARHADGTGQRAGSGGLQRPRRHASDSLWLMAVGFGSG